MVFHITAQLLALLCIIAGVPACSSTGAHYETSRTNAEGTNETRRVSYNNVRIRDDAPEAVGDLLNTAAPFLPPWVGYAASAVLGTLGGKVVTRPFTQRREDRLYDEAYDKGRADRPARS